MPRAVPPTVAAGARAVISGDSSGGRRGTAGSRGGRGLSAGRGGAGVPTVGSTGGRSARAGPAAAPLVLGAGRTRGRVVSVMGSSGGDGGGTGGSAGQRDAGELEVDVVE